MMEITLSRRGLFRIGARVFAPPAAALLCAPLLAGMAWAQEEAPGIFQSMEVAKTDLAPFPKWLGAKAKAEQEMANFDADCKPTEVNPCGINAWAKKIETLRGVPLLEQLQAVNDYLNQANYVVDMINWGIKDYWSSPGEFFSRFGDCEDYAIAKFLTLRELGVPGKNMRIVVLQDQSLNVAHAVLAVYLADRTLVLDNQIPQVVPEQSILHYLPFFSLNEEGWWLHRV